MCERGRENGIKETFYRDYTALLFSPSVSGADKWTWQRNAATERWGTWHLTAVEVIQNHFLIKFLMSPSVQLHLLIFQSRPPPPHQRSYTEAKQRQMSAVAGWIDGSLRGEKLRAKMETHNSNKLLGLLTNTRGLGEWLREEERMRNMWYFNKREEGRSWWFRDSCLLKSKTFFFILFHSQLFRLFFFPFWSSFLCFYVFTLGFVLNVLALSVKVIIIVIFCRWD